MADAAGGMSYNVDIVMCIDATYSMVNVMKEVKENALAFYGKFVDEMKAQQNSVGQVRVKVIAFRDYGCDAEPMKESEFFTLCEGEGDQSALLADFVNGIEPVGGGDIPENGLEAIHLAINSDWVATGSKKRHVIIVFSDAPALPLGDETFELENPKTHAKKLCKSRIGTPNYPEDAPQTLAELQEEWEEGQFMDGRGKRLMLFTPSVYPWDTMADWNQAYHTESSAGTGIPELQMDTVIHLLAHTIGGGGI